MKTIETQKIVEIQLTTSIMIVVILGKNMLIIPITRTETETKIIHQMLKVKPLPLNESKREKIVEKDRIMVHTIIITSIPKSIWVSLNSILQLTV